METKAPGGKLQSLLHPFLAGAFLPLCPGYLNTEDFIKGGGILNHQPVKSACKCRPSVPGVISRHSPGEIGNHGWAVPAPPGQQQNLRVGLREAKTSRYSFIASNHFSYAPLYFD